MDWLEHFLPYIEATATVLAAIAAAWAAMSARRAAWIAFLNLQSQFTTNSIAVGIRVTSTALENEARLIGIRYIEIDHHDDPEWKICSLRLVESYSNRVPPWLESKIRTFRFSAKWISLDFPKIVSSSRSDPHVSAVWQRKLRFFDPVFRMSLLLHPDATGVCFVIMKVVSNVNDDVKRTVIRSVEVPQMKWFE